MKILFVDDEKIIRDGISEIIHWKELGCESLMLADSADSALDILKKQTFDIVITDIYMQQMTGIELAKIIKENWPGTRVIILSAYEDFSYARDAIEAGVVKYLLKPIVPDELERAVREAMGQTHMDVQGADQIVAGSLKLIDQNISDEDFSVNDIAGKLHVSPSYFSRIFKKSQGITCIEYLTQKRIEKAKDILKYTPMTQEQIARAVGYSNVHYFSVIFKKQTGETPGQYRRRKDG